MTDILSSSALSDLDAMSDEEFNQQFPGLGRADIRSVLSSQPSFVVYPSAVSFPVWTSKGERRQIEARPQKIFRARGLWLWGCDETTFIHHLQSGMQLGFSIDSGPLPGLYFEAGMSFADFERLLATPRAEWMPERLKELPVVPEHQKIRLPTTELGNSLTIDVSGPLTHAVLWGDTVD